MTDDKDPCEIETYRDLLAKLNALGEEELDQKIQFMRATSEEPIPLGQVIAFDTVANFCNTGDLTRSSFDNQHHPESYVLLVDSNPYSKNGDMAYSFTEVKCPYCEKMTSALLGDHSKKTIIEPHECTPEQTAENNKIFLEEI